MKLDPVERKAVGVAAVATVVEFVISYGLWLVLVHWFFMRSGVFGNIGIFMILGMARSVLSFGLYVGIGVWGLWRVLPQGRRTIPITTLVLTPILFSVFNVFIGPFPFFGELKVIATVIASFLLSPIAVFGAVRATRPGAKQVNPHVTPA